MNIIDIAIILIILMCGVVGFKRGLTHELVSCVGFFLVVILSFMLKNPVSIFLYEHLPFFSFGGIFKGITALNIILYEFVAFILVMTVLIVILRILLFATKVFEKLLKFTIILGIPSKLLGAVVGLIEGYVWVFIILYIVSLPVFNFEIVKESKYQSQILERTPILSSILGDTINVINEFAELKDEYEVTDDSNTFNLKAMDLFIKYNLITVESTENLIKQDKLKIIGIDEVLNKYKER